MRPLRAFITLATILAASSAWGHGFFLYLNKNSQGTPISISSSSQQPVLDQDGTKPPASSPLNSNLFLDQFDQTGTNARGAYQQTNEGGPNIQGGPATWGAGTTYTFSMVSPLYFSDGGFAAGGPQFAVAQRATGTTNIYFSDAADPHPLTSSYHSDVAGGSLPPIAGFQLLDPYATVVGIEAGHELYKNIYIDPSSTQTDGEYGYAFTVTAHFAGGQTLTTGPLVDIFALYDPDGTNGGIDAFLNSDPNQDAATYAIYGAALRTVPEPSSLCLAIMGLAALAWRLRFRR